jgi:hypothetical protein
MKIAILKYDKIHHKQWKPEFLTISESDYEILIKAASHDAIAQGLEPCVVTFDPNRYTDWLGDREDSSDMRASWASFNL